MRYYGLSNFVGDVVLSIVSCGLWILWILWREHSLRGWRQY